MKSKITSIKKLDIKANRYDIEVEDNHNYYANNILVHNCRATINKDGVFSRNGKEWVTVPHIFESVKHLVEDGDLVLDGELYNHEFHDNFDKISSLVKKKKPTKEDLEESARLVEFHIFDCYSREKPEMSFSARYDLITDICEGLQHVEVVENIAVSTKEEAMEKFSYFIEEGYEGMMLRVPDSPYENKRSRFLLKYKEFQDEEFEILDITEGKGGRSGKMGRVLFKMTNGKTFEANARGNHAFYTKLLLDKEQLRGKMATVRYQNLTPDGIPRFGVMVCVRDYE